MFKTIFEAFKNPQLRKGMIVTILLLLVYRIGCYLPVPGIDAEIFTTAVTDDGATLLGLLNAVSGSALANGAFLALGVTPYINASIIVQLLTVAIPALERLSKQGDDGRKKINLITRIVAIVLAIAQGIGIVLGFGSTGITSVFGDAPLWITSTFVVVVFVAGSCFTMWLGERISEQKVGNGVSLIIFVGILSTAAQALVNAIVNLFNGNAASSTVWELVGFLILALVIFTIIVFFDMSERKIPVQYAKQVKGRKMYGGQSSFIPLKVNASGVMPIIFATAIITFPNLIMQLFGVEQGDGWFADFYYKYLATGSAVYSVLVGLLILFFAFFYAQIQFNPSEVAQTIQQHGGFIPGYRAGKPTADYLSKVSRRITLFGAIFLAFIAIVPNIVFGAVVKSQLGLLNAFTATGMLIVVSVAIEFQNQLESQILMKRHKNIL